METQQDTISMTSKPLIELHFSLISETLKKDEILELTPFKPTRSWQQGELILQSIMCYKHSGVRLTLPSIHSFYVDDAVTELLHFLAPYQFAIGRMTSNMPIEAEIACVAYCERPPAIYLSPISVKQIAAMGASFDLDMFISGDD